MGSSGTKLGQTVWAETGLKEPNQSCSSSFLRPRSRVSLVLFHRTHGVLGMGERFPLEPGRGREDPIAWRHRTSAGGVSSSFWWSLHPWPSTVMKTIVTIFWGLLSSISLLGSLNRTSISLFFIPNKSFIVLSFSSVSQSANASEIKKAYYKLSLK